jgi:phospholipase/carboxylesterase
MRVLKEEKSGLEYLKVDQQSKKCVVLLHGYGASMRDLYGLSSMIETKSPVDWIFPDGPIAVPLGPFQEGRAWFPIDMRELEIAMSRGEFRNFKDKCPPEFVKSKGVLLTFMSQLMDQYDKVIIGGFSQGAMLTTHLVAEIQSEKIKGMLLYSATLLAQKELMQALDGRRPLAFLQSHGKQDPLLDYALAMQLYELFKLYRFAGEFISFNGAHEIPMVVIEKTSQFMKEIF